VRRRWRAIAGLILGLLVLPGATLWLASRFVAPPSFTEVRAAWVPSEAWLLDRHGEPLQSRRRDSSVRRLAWTPLAELSPALIRAILLAEDRRFPRHGGLDLRALLGALGGYFREGRRRGASTLTMQLAGLLEPSLGRPGAGRDLGQKLRQAAYALALERQWRKADILEAYLNRVGFRGELQGIAASARALFGKHPSGLDESESILLAALLPAPNADPVRLGRRACAIAREGGFLSRCTRLQALAAATLAHPPAAGLREVELAPALARRLLAKPGDHVVTTLDTAIQRRVLSVLERQLAGLTGRNVRDAAALVMDNASGEVLAYVGSAGAASTAAAVDGAAARRQAGSTLKPFLYGLALERRYLTPASILDDSPVNLETASGLYIPQNYDHAFKGPVSVRTALSASLNVPAVRTLVLVGVEAFRDRLVALGYAGLTESGEHYGFSLALGSADVSLLEQVNAYRTLANRGIWSPPRFRMGAADAGGRRRVMQEAATFLVADILADNASRAVTFGLDSPLATRFWSAVKTGTSKDMRDNWCIGFGARYTVGVWVGNFEGDAMRDVSGISGAAPAWAAIMAGLEGEGPVRSAPDGVVREAVRFEPAVEPARQEWFLAGTQAAVIRHGGFARGRVIESPPDGVIVALDPDIPAANQRLPFRASGGEGAEFVLDGRAVGTAGGEIAWLPAPGLHRLQLRRRSDGRVLDTVDFSVRPPAH